MNRNKKEKSISLNGVISMIALPHLKKLPYLTIKTYKLNNFCGIYFGGNMAELFYNIRHIDYGGNMADNNL